MIYLEYSLLNQAQQRNSELLAAAIANNLCSAQSTSFANIIERNGKFYLPVEPNFIQLYTPTEINGGIALPPTDPVSILAQIEAARRDRLRQAQLYLSQVISPTQLEQLSLDLDPYLHRYFIGVDQDNIMLQLLRDNDFLANHPYLTANQSILPTLNLIFTLDVWL